MSVEKKLFLEGVAQKSIVVNPGEVMIMPLRITSGVEDAEPGVEYYLDVTTYCRNNNDFGFVTFPNPIKNREQTHILTEDVDFHLGIRLDDGREGHIIWSHNPQHEPKLP